MKKVFNFDMDGTIADLYAVDNWLAKLCASDPSPYANARPLVNMSRLAKALHKVQRAGHEVRIVSWLSKNSDAAYDAAVTEAKKGWLKKHLPSVDWDKVLIVAYGTPKHEISNGILFDDEERNRNNWGAGAFEPKDIFEVLTSA